MSGRHIQLESAAMGRKVHLWAYGHAGQPIIVFPSAAGFAHEWDAQGMVGVLQPFLDKGKIRLYCPESNVAEAWTRKESPLPWRMERHQAYERFVGETLVPFVRHDARIPEAAPLWTMGCSLGAMYAANFALKQPRVFRRAICMSGRYLATALTNGETCEALYFQNTLAFVRGMGGDYLELVRKNTQITLVCGQGPYEEGCIEETIALGELLDKKGIPNWTDIWGKDSRHDWDWWRKQVVYHLTHALR